MSRVNQDLLYPRNDVKIGIWSMPQSVAVACEPRVNGTATRAPRHHARCMIPWARQPECASQSCILGDDRHGILGDDRNVVTGSGEAR
jgi:hypothetical protein